MECYTCQDAAGVLSRFEFVYFAQKFHRMKDYGELNKDACCKKVYNEMAEIEKLFPRNWGAAAFLGDVFPTCL